MALAIPGIRLVPTGSPPGMAGPLPHWPDVAHWAPKDGRQYWATRLEPNTQRGVMVCPPRPTSVSGIAAGRILPAEVRLLRVEGGRWNPSNPKFELDRWATATLPDAVALAEHVVRNLPSHALSHVL